MSGYRKIEDLSKEELLGLIYNRLGNTIVGYHPCLCVLCGKDNCNKAVDVEIKYHDKEVKHCHELPYVIVCDDCTRSINEHDDYYKNLPPSKTEVKYNGIPVL